MENILPHGPAAYPGSVLPVNILIELQDRKDEGEKLLRRCTRFGSYEACRLLIDAGVNIGRNLPRNAISAGNGHLLRLFLGTVTRHHHDVLDDLLSFAVRERCSHAVIVLKEYFAAGSREVFTRHLALAVKERATHLLRNLLEAGGDANADGAAALCLACRLGDLGSARELITFGADPTSQNDEPLKHALRAGHMSLVMFLLNNGADHDVVVRHSISAPDLPASFVRAVLAGTRIERLRIAIRNSSRRLDFRWQVLALPGRLTLTGWRQLLHQAQQFGLEPEGLWSLGKRGICKRLAEECYPHDVEDERPSPDELDLVGNRICDLPVWQRFRSSSSGVLYNVFDLFHLLDIGKDKDPFHFQPLPLADIKRRREFLQRTLLPSRFRQENLLDQVAECPLPSATTVLRQALISFVWDKIPYPPSTDIIVDASDEDIDRMVRKLCMVTNGCRPYNMIDDVGIGKVQRLTGVAKKTALVDLLRKIVAQDDEWAATRAELVGILMRHCDRGVTETGEDLYGFMLHDRDDENEASEYYDSYPDFGF
jgi:ankyrin repeat protein